MLIVLYLNVSVLSSCLHALWPYHARLSSYLHGAITVDFLEGFYRPYDARQLIYLSRQIVAP